MEVKRKELTLKIADFDNQKRIVKAYFASFGNIDKDGEVIQKGSTLKTISENGPKGKDIIRHFLNHEFRNSDNVLPIGKILEIGEDSYGGYFVSKIATTQQGNDVYSLYQDGFINSHSFGFIPVKVVKTATANIITELRMFEVSTVTTWAANDNTPTVYVKSSEAGIFTTSQNNNKSLFIEPPKALITKADFQELISKIDYSLFKF